MTIKALLKLCAKIDKTRDPAIATQACEDAARVADRIPDGFERSAHALVLSQVPRRNCAKRMLIIAIYTARRSWPHSLRKLACAIALGSTRSTIIAKGNGKLPFYCFSSLPIFSCPGFGPCSEYCYSFKSWRYPDGFIRQAQNFWLLKVNKILISKAFEKVRGTFRLYVDGDFDSVETLAFWQDHLKARADVFAYGYSKSFKTFLSYYADGGTFADSYLLNVSNGHRFPLAIEKAFSALPCARGRFDVVDSGMSARAFSRLPAKEQRRVALAQCAKAGIEKPFICPGKCGDCMNGSHACGNEKMRGKSIVNMKH